MQTWHTLELEYAKRLRTSNRQARKSLYGEAYSVVSAEVMKFLPAEPEQRVSGTSRLLVETIRRHCGEEQTVLEIGCGRGFTCLCLAPHVGTIVGTDVSTTVLAEATELLHGNNVTNAEIIRLGADELTTKFSPDTFDTAISIDVYEHLHPEDAAEHLKQVLLILKPGGRYILVTPNRLTGPHDITRLVDPKALEAKGFHLNETTGQELVDSMRQLGFCGFRIVPPWFWTSRRLRGISLPFVFQQGLETVYGRLRRPPCLKRRIAGQLGLMLIARKPAQS